MQWVQWANANARGGIGKGHVRWCVCSYKGHRELDSAWERIHTFTSSRLKELKRIGC